LVTNVDLALMWEKFAARFKRHGEFKVHCERCGSQYVARPYTFDGTARHAPHGMVVIGWVKNCPRCTGSHG
jgi:hypothetical protein